MDKYLVVIEKSKHNYPAFSPDVLGCAATGNTVEETLSQMKEALSYHSESLINDGDELPLPKGISFHIDDGIFDKGEIADQYFITGLDITIPQHA
jgi:predicted RNase H-like HicB family nuclease